MDNSKYLKADEKTHFKYSSTLYYSVTNEMCLRTYEMGNLSHINIEFVRYFILRPNELNLKSFSKRPNELLN